MKVIICYDYVRSDCCDYVTANDYIKSQIGDIHTNCLSFFSFEYLKKVDDIVIRQIMGKYISVRELLDHSWDGYTNKDIREAHNIYKMLIAGAFIWRKE